MAHIHEIKDAETHFIVDATTREISNAGELPALVQNDHNSERFTFVVPRTVDGHDMSICNKTRVHYLNIDSATKKQYADVYEVDDLHVDETDETKVVCTWLISRYATQHAGSLNFIVEYACEKDGVIDYAWNTAIFKGITVKNGINNAEQVLTEYTDILEKWKQSVLEELKQSGTGSGSGSGLTEEQLADFEANTEARHTHTNGKVLDRFSIDNFGTRPAFSGFPLAYEDELTVPLETQDDIEKAVNSPDELESAQWALNDVGLKNYHDAFVAPLSGGNGEANHMHTNKEILDLFGINYAGTRPTFGGSSQNNVLATIGDAIDRDNSVRTGIPNNAAVEGSTLKMQRVIGNIVDDLFSVELPIGETSNYISPYHEGSVVTAETEYEQRAIDAYNAMMSECMGNSEKIPFLLQTDNHDYFPKSVYDLCAKMINFAQFSQVLTLGDIAGNYFHETHLQNYVDAMKVFPIEKKTAIAGNHDVWVGASDRSYIDQAKLSTYLKNYTLRRYGNNGYGVLADDYFNVKYLIISNYDKEEGEGGSRISTKQVNFIIDELSKKDGYDVVILSHEPISLSDSTTTALLEAGIYTTMGNYFSFISSRGGFISMLLARKNKGSGTYTDDEGVEHTYDFTDCNSELLCCFCGHTHVEGFDFINGELLNVAWGGINHADGHPMYFGYIDKKNRLLKYYRVAGDYSASVTVGLDKVNATNMTLDKAEITMNVGETKAISPVFTPITAGNQRIAWASSDSSVATVKKGFVSGIAEGTATITAIAEDGSFTATCFVTVGTPEEPGVPEEPEVPDKPASNLPNEYQEVEYIYTTAYCAAHIPTTTSLMPGDKGYISASMTTSHSADQAFCGLKGSGEIYITNGKFAHWQYTALVSPAKDSPCEWNTKYNIEFDITSNINNLFLMAYDEVNKYGMIGRMYSARFTRSGVDIYNFVPCYRKADGKIGMYDTVNNVFAEGVGELFLGSED